MATITDLTLAGDSFALGALLTNNPEMHVEIERLVPLGDRLLPFFWVSNGSTEHIEAELVAQDIVESVERLTTVDDRHLYQVTWTPEVNGIVDALMQTDGAILEGKGITGQWEPGCGSPTATPSTSSTRSAWRTTSRSRSTVSTTPTRPQSRTGSPRPSGRRW
ncbi:bacterio-opsin activator domain-containing protein [Halomicroarcula sp. GCM10025710]